MKPQTAAEETKVSFRESAYLDQYTYPISLGQDIICLHWHAWLCLRHHLDNCCYHRPKYGTVWAAVRKQQHPTMFWFFFFFFYIGILLSALPHSCKDTTHCGGGGASWQSSWFIPHLQYKYKTEQATWGWLLEGPFSLINSSCKMITSKAIFVCKATCRCPVEWWSHRKTCVAFWQISKDQERLFKRLRAWDRKDLNGPLNGKYLQFHRSFQRI